LKIRGRPLMDPKPAKLLGFSPSSSGKLPNCDVCNSNNKKKKKNRRKWRDEGVRNERGGRERA